MDKKTRPLDEPHLGKFRRLIADLGEERILRKGITRHQMQRAAAGLAVHTRTRAAVLRAIGR